MAPCKLLMTGILTCIRACIPAVQPVRALQVRSGQAMSTLVFLPAAQQAHKAEG